MPAARKVVAAPVSRGVFQSGLTTQQDALAASVTANAPSLIVAGNLLVAVIFIVADAIGDVPIVAPTGWVAAGNSGMGGQNQYMAVFTKIATNAEPASYTFNVSSGTARWDVDIRQYQSASDIDLIAFAFGWSSGATSPVITTTSPRTVIVAAALSGAISTPGGLNNLDSTPNSLPGQYKGGDLTQSAAGAAGGQFFFNGTNNPWAAVTVAIK